jgi:ABC-2 type transport system permease protein
MIAVLRSEWLKLRTTSIPWLLTAIALVVTGLTILVYFVNHGTGGPRDHSDFGPPTPNIPHTTQQLRDLLGSGVGIYVFALLLGVLIITVEFRHKTVTTSFLTTPHRTRFVAGKLLIAAITGAVLAVVVLIGTVVGGGIALAALGGSFTALAHQIGAVAPGMILVYALFAVLGVGVGSLLTNQVAAIVVSLGWFLILENIIGAIWHGTVKWLPSGAALAASNVSAGTREQIFLFNWWQGSLLILVYGIAFAALGSFVLARRDIT